MPRSAVSEPVPPSGPSVGRAARDEALFARYRDPRDRVDRDAVVERFLPLARQLAARYERPTEPFDDIFQVACLGLVKAVDRFDADRGVAFSSYAVPTITGEIKRHFRDRTWAIRVPRDLQELSLRVDRVVAELARGPGGQPSVKDVAQVVGVEPEDVLEAMQASAAYRATSLDAPLSVENDNGTLGDAIGRDDDGYAGAEQRAALQALMRYLTRRQQNVVRLRFEHDLTQAEIGERIGVGQMQVSRILRQSLARMRTIANTHT